VEEEAWEREPTAQQALCEARAAYRAGDYVSLETYIAREHEP
jgi:hypothetical protein